MKLFIRFAIAKGAVTYGLELMMALFKIVQGYDFHDYECRRIWLGTADGVAAGNRDSR